MTAPSLPSDEKIIAANKALLELRKSLIEAGLTDGDIVGVLFTEVLAMLIAALGPQRAVEHVAMLAQTFVDRGGPAIRH